jgi:hypothetical protein
VRLALHRSGGRLVVHAPTGSAVILDGKPIDVDPDGARVAPGAHALRVTADGMAPYEASVDVSAGATRTIDVALQPASKGKVWPWVVGGAVIVASAAIGSYFLFRPADEASPQTRGSAPPGVVQLPFSR